jgi:cell division septal protein FtsQ
MYEKTYKAKVLNQSDSVVKKNKKLFSWKKVIFVVIFLGVLFGFGFLLRYHKMQVDTFNVIGTSVIGEQDVEDSVREQLVGSWLWIFPRTSVLLVNDKLIERKLKEQFSRIETISVKRTNLHSIEITIKEFDAVYLWCTTVEENCYFMDKQGIVYSEAPVFSGTAYPKVFTGAPVEELPFLGISETDLSRVADLQQKLSEINIIPVAFRDVSARELQIDFLHNKTIAKLQIDRSTPTDTSLEYLFSGIRTEPLASLFRNESKVLLYIDVRFPNKVVYKFQE